MYKWLSHLQIIRNRNSHNMYHIELNEIYENERNIKNLIFIVLK